MSENSDKDIAKRYALQKVGDCLRALTANLLRVTRGAGRSHQIIEQLNDLAIALNEYRSVTGTYPFDEMAPELRLEDWGDPERDEHYSVEYVLEKSAHQTILRGALQVVASELLDQRLQVTAGEREMNDGYRQLEELRAARRKRLQEQYAKPKPSHGRKKKKPSDWDDV